MPQCETKYFGTVSYQASAVIEFPGGLPGFENRRRFLPIEDTSRQPLIFLQSLEEPRLCFLTLPVVAVDPSYQLKMSAEDLAAIGLEKLPALSSQALCLAVVAMAEGGLPTVNLLAPIVVNCRNGKAVQSVRDDTAYGCCHLLAVASELTPCS